jgi:hypothetical protein
MPAYARLHTKSSDSDTDRISQYLDGLVSTGASSYELNDDIELVELDSEEAHTLIRQNVREDTVDESARKHLNKQYRGSHW